MRVRIRKPREAFASMSVRIRSGLRSSRSARTASFDCLAVRVVCLGWSWRVLSLHERVRTAGLLGFQPQKGLSGIRSHLSAGRRSPTDHFLLRVPGQRSQLTVMASVRHRAPTELKNRTSFGVAVHPARALTLDNQSLTPLHLALQSAPAVGPGHPQGPYAQANTDIGFCPGELRGRFDDPIVWRD